jgi:imidazolonepropionase-like amidohydrolase
MHFNVSSLHRIGLTLAAPLVLAVVAANPPQGVRGPENAALALIGATVIDGTGAPPIPDAVVIVEGERIVAVGPRARVSVPPGALRREIAGMTILPGLIDSHVHLGLALPQGQDPAQADTAVNSLLNEFLRYGVTSIRDLGDAYPWIVELARSVNSGDRCATGRPSFRRRPPSRA